MKELILAHPAVFTAIVVLCILIFLFVLIMIPIMIWAYKSQKTYRQMRYLPSPAQTAGAGAATTTPPTANTTPPATAATPAPNTVSVWKQAIKVFVSILVLCGLWVALYNFWPKGYNWLHSDYTPLFWGLMIGLPILIVLAVFYPKVSDYGTSAIGAVKRMQNLFLALFVLTVLMVTIYYLCPPVFNWWVIERPILFIFGIVVLPVFFALWGMYPKSKLMYPVEIVIAIIIGVHLYELYKTPGVAFWTINKEPEAEVGPMVIGRVANAVDVNGTYQGQPVEVTEIIQVKDWKWSNEFKLKDGLVVTKIWTTTPVRVWINNNTEKELPLPKGETLDTSQIETLQFIAKNGRSSVTIETRTKKK